MTKNIESTVRREDLLIAALALAHKQDYRAVTRAAVAEAAGVSDALVSYHFGTMHDFKRALMSYAVKQWDKAVVLQGLVAKDPVARRASVELKKAALESMLR